MQARSRSVPTLVDRQRERAALDGLLGDLRAGRGRALVVRGQAGVGKSALLEYLTGAAADMRVARAVGVESEMELAFASLHLLCGPLLDRVEGLPPPQRDALGIAFGLREGDAPDRFLVGLAVLTLLSEAAEPRPLLCVIDDAQWLDRASAQVLVFAARRLLAEPVGLVFAAREPGEQFRGLADLEVRGLPDQDARALLGSVVRFRLDERVRDRVLAEADGNPLALLELPRGLDPAQLAAGFGLVEAQAVPTRIEQGFRRRIEALPADTRTLMLVAAAEPTGDAMVVWQAAGRLGIPAAAVEAASADGLLQIGTRVRFRHPLVRSAVYAAAPLPGRRAAHRVLAEVTDRDGDPDRRAWHLAAAAPGPDEEVAAELERSAGRAQARGGMAAAAAFLQRAVALTAEPGSRVERALAAAQANLQAGAFDAALELVAVAEAGPLDEFASARVDLLRGQVASAVNAGSDAPPLLLKAAKRLERLDLDLARETYLNAWGAAFLAGTLAGAGDLHEVSRAARALPTPPRPPRPLDLLLDGLVLTVTDGRFAAAPVLRQAISAFAGPGTPAGERLRWGWLAQIAPILVWDEDGWRSTGIRQTQLARDVGALDQLPIDLTGLGMVVAWSGDFPAAAVLVAEQDALCEAIGSRFAPYAGMLLVCLRGWEAEAVPLIQSVIEQAEPAGQGIAVQYARWVTAILCNGLGRYEEALTAARQASQDTPELYVANWALVELIEAAARTGNPPARRRCARSAGTDHSSGGNRTGAGHRRALACAAERGPERRRLVPRGDRPARPHPAPPRTGPGPPALRRMAAPPEPAQRRPRTAPDRPRHVHRNRHGGLRRARPPRTGRRRRDRPPTHHRGARHAHPPRGPDRPPGPRRLVQPGDRRPAVPQPAHGRMAPAQSIHQTRDQLPPATPASAARRPARLSQAVAQNGPAGRARACSTASWPGNAPSSSYVAPVGLYGVHR
jgi:tetratricopeptide (TPR) repeat protein